MKDHQVKCGKCKTKDHRVKGRNARLWFPNMITYNHRVYSAKLVATKKKFNYTGTEKEDYLLGPAPDFV